jgi:hypothetical protein
MYIGPSKSARVTLSRTSRVDETLIFVKTHPYVEPPYHRASLLYSLRRALLHRTSRRASCRASGRVLSRASHRGLKFPRVTRNSVNLINFRSILENSLNSTKLNLFTSESSAYIYIFNHLIKRGVNTYKSTRKLIKWDLITGGLRPNGESRRRY